MVVVVERRLIFVGYRRLRGRGHRRRLRESGRGYGGGWIEGGWLVEGVGVI